ncbi:MAG: serine/threonine protein kinase [Chlorobi bacterium]|nr:serine/threonine protein kinase [Chlorobiota bacterium]
MKSYLLFPLLLGILASGCSGLTDPEAGNGDRIIYNEVDSNKSYISSIGTDGRENRRITEGVYMLTSPAGGRMMYMKIDSARRLVTAKIDGSDLHEIYNDFIRGSISPDGRHVIYVVLSAGQHNSFLVNIDGTDKREIVNNDCGCRDDFSPDSRSYSLNSRGALYVGDVATASTHSIVSVDSAHQITESAWSPLGNAIMYVVDDTTSLMGSTIYIADPDGGHQRATYSGATLSEIEWSRDGRKVAFIQGERLWVMNADGTGLKPLTDGSPAVQGFRVQWSADNRRIVFTEDQISSRNSCVAIVDVETDAVAVVAPSGYAGFFAR